MPKGDGHVGKKVVRPNLQIVSGFLSRVKSGNVLKPIMMRDFRNALIAIQYLVHVVGIEVAVAGFFLSFKPLGIVKIGG